MKLACAIAFLRLDIDEEVPPNTNAKPSRRKISPLGSISPSLPLPWRFV
jgi:hypothetical protein